jgi:hypothetical protein
MSYLTLRESLKSNPTLVKKMYGFLLECSHKAFYMRDLKQYAEELGISVDDLRRKEDALNRIQNRILWLSLNP